MVKESVPRPRWVRITVEEVAPINDNNPLRIATYLIDNEARAEFESNTRFEDTRPCEANNWAQIIESKPTGRYDFTLTIENGLLVDSP